MEFKEYRFNEIATLLNGRAYLMPELQNEGKYRIVRVGNFSGKDEWFYSDMELTEDKYCSNGDLLFKWACNFGPEIWKEEKVIYHYHIWKVLTNASLVDKMFLYYYLFYFTPILLGSTNGATMVHITKSTMEKKKFLIPKSVEVQKTIATIISKYDELIEINNKRIKLLEQIVENYFKLFYENEIKNHQVNIVKLGKLLDITRGLSYSSEEIECDDGITLINLKNIQGFGGFRRDGNKCYNGDYKEAQVVKQGDLVMGVTDMTQDRRTVGSVALIPDIAGVSVISADLIKIETDINKSFLYCLFRFGNVSKYISQFANGANVLHLKPEVIKKVKVMMPTQEYIKAFCRIVTPILDEIEMLYQQNDNLIKQRDLLLPRLMSGKLSVETKTESVPKVKKVISFDDFRSNMGMAARAKTISDEDLRAMYEAYIDDDATE